MKKFSITLSVLVAITLSCNTLKDLRNFIYKTKISIDEAIKEREKIDHSDNPAYKQLAIDELKEKRIVLKNVLVKDIITSGNIDYNFCVIVSVPHEKGQVECYLYTKKGFYGIYGQEDIDTIAKIEKGVTRINAIGDFERFFTLLDEAYIRIDIINTKISILDKDEIIEEKKPDKKEDPKDEKKKIDNSKDIEKDEKNNK